MEPGSSRAARSATSDPEIQQPFPRSLSWAFESTPNIASLTAQRNLSEVTGRLQGNYSRLSSGLRIATAADDAAGLGISERMRAQIASFKVAQRNAQDGTSLVQTGEGALNEANNIVSRMRELAVQAANGTLSSTDRNTIDTEFQALMSEVGRISSTTTFNGVHLLDGTTTSLAIQVGIHAGEVINITLQTRPPPRSASAVST